MTDKQLLVFAIFSLFILNPTSSQQGTPSPGPTSSTQVYCWDSGTIVSSNPSVLQYYQASDLTNFQTWWSNLGSKNKTCKVSYKNDFNPSAGSLTDCTTSGSTNNWLSSSSFRCPLIAILNQINNYDGYYSEVSGSGTEYDVSTNAFTTLVNGATVSSDCQEYQLLMGLNVMYLSYLAYQIQCFTVTSQSQSIMTQLDTLLRSTLAIAIIGNATSGSISSVTNNPYIYNLMSTGSFYLTSPLSDTYWSPSNTHTLSFYNYSNSSIYTSSSVSNTNFASTNYQAMLLTDMSNSVQSGNCLC